MRGLRKRDGVYYTAGGRVLGVTARAADLETAVARAYEACGKISFEGAHYRRGYCGESAEEVVRVLGTRRSPGLRFNSWSLQGKGSFDCGTDSASESNLRSG